MADEESPLLASTNNHSINYTSDDITRPHISQNSESSTVVFNGVDGLDVRRKWPQYIAAFSANIGAFITGAAIGWSSPATPRITTGNEYGFKITDKENALIESFYPLGGVFVCFGAGIFINRIGCKPTMLTSSIPFVVGWLLMIYAINIKMLLAGRIILGIAGGISSIVIPIYVNEIAEDEIKGILGTLFQLTLTIGVLFSFVIGSYFKMFILNWICLILSLVFVIVFALMPEAPYYLVYRNNIDMAKKTLKWLRGTQYNIESEIEQICDKVRISRENPISFSIIYRNKSARKALLICQSLMIFMQTSGINGILFNTVTIFRASDINIPPHICIIIFASIQVFATFISTLSIERVGRKFLLVFSATIMTVCLSMLSLYFYVLRIKDSHAILFSDMVWVPLFSLCLFIIAYSVGFGPIPWLISGELCSSDIKPYVSACSGTICWFFAFLVTTTFETMTLSLGTDGTFCLYACITVIAVLYVLCVVPETKGRTIDDIQRILSGENLDTELPRNGVFS